MDKIRFRRLTYIQNAYVIASPYFSGSLFHAYSSIVSLGMVFQHQLLESDGDRRVLRSFNGCGAVSVWRVVAWVGGGVHVYAPTAL